MKICTNCKLELPLDSFNKKKDWYQNYCRSCDNKRARDYYSSNREHHKAVVRKRNKKYLDTTRNWIRELKESNPCVDCNISYPWYVMDFDHVRGQKVSDISKMVATAASKDKLIEEISKCEIVCSNCHRIRTFTR
jgi:hypothetical protein